MASPKKIISSLNNLVSAPTLVGARQLEAELRSAGLPSKLYGRLNQKSSIEAAAESDRGIVERIANAFDASLSAARALAGSEGIDPTLTPRVAAQRFLSPNPDSCAWEPQDPDISFGKPVVQFWSDSGAPALRFRRYHSPEGLVTALIRDTSLGISRERMPRTILDLNSDDKLTTFEAIGQFGHGGSSALAFCELCLIVTAPRFDAARGVFYWTLIFPELESAASKQPTVRKWFCAGDGLPFEDDLDSIGRSLQYFPGTSIWHYGFTRGNWLKTPVGTHQDTPAGRLGRLFFSYPLPFEIHGEFARGDTATGVRTIKGAYYRLLEERSSDRDVVQCRSGEKSETLRVQGVSYGTFSVYIFVLKDSAHVRNYVEKDHPVIITLNGQNHGEMTGKLLVDANLPEISGRAIVEIRIDGLDAESLSNIVSNSREMPKHSQFTRALVDRVVEVLAEDEELIEIEHQLQDEKARQSSEGLNQKISSFLSSILSDASGGPTVGGAGTGPGKQGRRGKPRPEVPCADPPHILEFVSSSEVLVPEGTTKILKFMSDARPPKYSFHGDNPRCFARLLDRGPRHCRLAISGRADIDGRGYGSVSVACIEAASDPISDSESASEIELVLQTADGRTLTARLEVGVAPKPERHERKRKQAVRPQITFCAPSEADLGLLKDLLHEEKIGPLTSSLEKYRDLLEISDSHATYWGVKTEREGESWLIIEINAGHPRFVNLLKSCATVEERVQTKERVVQDIVLDCYQHTFRLDDIPDSVHEQVVTEPDDLKRAAEVCLNFDKAIRLASVERKMVARA